MTGPTRWVPTNDDLRAAYAALVLAAMRTSDQARADRLWELAADVREELEARARVVRAAGVRR